FDDGTPSYVGLPDLHIVCRPLPEVWEDIQDEANREFIKVYPNPPMVQYRPGQPINVEFEGVQRRTEVEQIDCSCVVYKDDEHKGWLYRGSLRLEHMANMKKRVEESKDKPTVTRPNAGKCLSTANTIHKTSTAAASKPHVTASAPLGMATFPSFHSPSNPCHLLPDHVRRPYGQNRSTGESSVITAKGSVTFTLHRCCPACLECIRSKVEAKHRGLNPLLCEPCEFRRECPRRVNNKVGVGSFLSSVSVTTTHQPRPYKINILDLTLGRENQPMSCINELSNIRPISVIYNKQRVAASAVSLNTSSDFLVGCNCTDGCRNRSSCSCHQLTIQAPALSPGGPEDVNVGYEHKRLEKRLSAGIYECNALCRCDPRVCSNRVVQHGLQLRLQLFMTAGKSWGIRCLDDVAKGTFICTTGIIMNKKSLGTEGNMYVVNLNHIEGAESKEGYESETRCSDNESGSEEEPIEDSESSEHDDCDGGDDEGKDEEEGNHEREQRRMMKKNSDDEDEEQPDDDENYEDKDYDVSEDDGDSDFRHNVSSMERRHVTHRHAKILQEDPAKKSGSDAKSSDQQDGTAEGNDKQASNATRRYFDGEESCYIIDAKLEGNVGRYLNHSCHPNLFAQNVFVDTHDLRFPWVAFFTSKRIRAGTELAWDYKCELGVKRSSRILNCRCDPECREKL
ncbi:LOW QUALITY PROTEIN: histone-lysine N-methyltransferase SETDB1-A, partial [Salvelinus alpinus]